MTTLPAGLAATDMHRIKFFRESNTAFAFYRGRKVHFSELPEHILMIFRKEIKHMPVRCARLGITEDMSDEQKLEIYLRHEYGELDLVPDLDEHGKTHREIKAEEAVAEYKLTAREVDVLKLIAAGCTISQVAEFLYISPNTAQVHSHNIKEKIGAKSSIDMARFAIRYNLVLV